MRNAIGTACAVLLSVSALGLTTDAGRTFTAEGARRASVARSPRELPPARLVDVQGREISLSGLPGDRVLVEFVYTACLDLCQRMTRSFAQTAAALEGEPVSLVSITFDPERDTPERLARYADFFGADGERWRFARIADPAELERWLAVFGIVVIPDAIGGFEHNAAIHEVDRAGRLVAIHDFDSFQPSDLRTGSGPG